MRKLGIALTTLLLLGVLVLMLFGSGLLPFSATEKEKRTVWRPEGFFTSSRQEEADYTFAAVPILKVKNPLGDIRVQGTDGQEILVSLTKKTTAPLNRQAEELLHKITLEITEDEQGKELTVNIPPTGDGEKAEAHLFVKVPYATKVDLHGGLGSIFVSATQGQLRVINESGPIELSQHSGNAALETYLGNIRIGGADLTDELVAITKLGDLFVAGRLAAKNVLESELGNLTLLLPPDDAYILEGEFSQGDFSTTIPFKGEHSGGRVKGIIGEGKHRGSIIVNLKLGSLRLTDGKGGDK